RTRDGVALGEVGSAWSRLIKEEPWPRAVRLAAVRDVRRQRCRQREVDRHPPWVCQKDFLAIGADGEAGVQLRTVAILARGEDEQISPGLDGDIGQNPLEGVAGIV